MYRKVRNHIQATKVRKHEGCAFCTFKCPKLNPKKRVVHSENNNVIVLDNMFPYDYWEHLDVAEHLMVIPRRHVTTMSDLTPEERKDMMDIMCDYESRGYNVYTRAPQSTVRTIAHIHTHLIKTKKSGRRHKFFAFWVNKPYLLIEK